LRITVVASCPNMPLIAFANLVFSPQKTLKESLTDLRGEVKPLVLRAVGVDGCQRHLLRFVLCELPTVVQGEADERLGEVVDRKHVGFWSSAAQKSGPNWFTASAVEGRGTG
jgi:hypothetical protein